MVKFPFVDSHSKSSAKTIYRMRSPQQTLHIAVYTRENDQQFFVSTTP